MTPIVLATVSEEELHIFKEELQTAFMKGLQDSFRDAEDPTEMGPLPSDEDFERSLTDPNSIVRQLLLDGERVGGVVLRINENTQLNEVDFLYTLSSAHGKGIGTKALAPLLANFPFQTSVNLSNEPFLNR